MSITDSKNTNDPNSPLYYAPRRVRDHVPDLGTAELRLSGQSTPTVPLQPQNRPGPAWSDPDELPLETSSPQPPHSREGGAVESLRDAERRAQQAGIVALAGRFAVVSCIAAAVAFAYVFYLSTPTRRDAAQTRNAGATAPAVHTGKRAIERIHPAAATTAFTATDPTTKQPLPLNVKAEDQARNPIAAFKVLPANTQSTFGSAPHAGRLPASTDPPVKIIPTIAFPRANGDNEPARQIKPEVIAAMLSRAELLLSTGDVPAARLLLQRAAEAHNARAAFELAATYDPMMIKSSGNIGPRPDVALAKAWYQKARDWGSPDAGKQLYALRSAEK